MFEIRNMKPEDKGAIMSLVKDFYQSDAVDHQVSIPVLEQTFQDAVSDDPILRGLALMEDGKIVGYAYVTMFYACETGGKNVMIEELCLAPSCRGKGYGSQFFKWLFQEYQGATRFRLEVTPSNQGASKLYEKMGFQFLEYRQMVLDTRKE